MKRLLMLLLTMIMIVSFATTALAVSPKEDDVSTQMLDAAEVNENVSAMQEKVGNIRATWKNETEEVSLYAVTLPPHVIEDPPGGGSYAGVLTIFACTEGLNSFIDVSGHAFLSFKNTSSQAITIGSYEVAVNEEITIGTWGNQPYHDGMWFNLEAYFIHAEEKFPNHVSIGTTMTQNDVDNLNNMIANRDFWYLPLNCSVFASNIWNALSPIYLSVGAVPTPTTLVSSIRSVSGYVTNRAIQANYNIGYTANGAFVPVKTSDVIPPEEYAPTSVGDAVSKASIRCDADESTIWRLYT